MPNLVRWNPNRDMVSLRDMMDRWLEETFDRPFGATQFVPNWGAPALDVIEEEDKMIVKAEVPGLSAEDINVTIQNDQLTISGEFKEEEEQEGKHYHRRERRMGHFERTLNLPNTLNTEDVDAEFKDGILTLAFQKLEEVKPKRIEISTS